MWRRGFLFGLAALLASAAAAEAPRLALPVACTLGENCYIQNYVDTLPAEGRVADYACGALSYDGHKGTDFALATRAEMEAGVAVLAAADGVVRGLRDGMPDTGLTANTRASLAGRECGNGVVIDHGAGWISQYCHLKRGSVRVTTGQRLVAGTPLGLIGLSGRSEFPHLHFALRHNDQVIDPFDPDNTATCGAAAQTLWADPWSYQPGGLLGLGFASAVPEYSDIKQGTAHSTLSTEAPALVLWGYTYGTRANDILRLEITGPEGFRFVQNARIERPQALGFRAAGKRRSTKAWPEGRYIGQVTLLRGQQPLARQSCAITLSAPAASPSKP